MALPDGLASSMKKFQAHNDVPVFLKGGPADKVLFGLTVGLCGLGIIGMLQMVYTLGFKKKSA
ncbi:PREDICTED: cytochrome c oxidase subunit 7A1, mitochondrial [Bactrocera latifrons]|uniref:cytochrome c oxidase subunit 7A1, mitochondrial n=1 Tax=Bactrocera latifrons TaxID=174628 RepID=UPI0008DCC258|nr:PREDICTED: cytochrome c oxidase subunit 7A1, mitochondrial [Bactrocera latifrons]XP_018787541.1 PREDICTED: cytochrome c oxidase subunit 7A1, mitochondrial [Bactrocera latifrons]